MITVRFPSGFSIQYNDANYVSRHEEYSDLLTKKDGYWVAQVPNTAVIEMTPACRTYGCLRDETTETVRALMQSEFKTIQRQIRLLKKSGR